MSESLSPVSGARAGRLAQPLLRFEQLIEVFAELERPATEFKIGAESEKFGVHRQTGAPLSYEGNFGVLRVLDALRRQGGFAAHTEYPGGPVIALKRDGASITLEPGAQLELSGAPLADLHAVQDELRTHWAELAPISEALDIRWLPVGFHPLATQAELPWVPKQRYAIMREYLPTRGNGALDMMRRTATVQGNFDWSSERDALSKLVTSLKLAPLLHVMTANAPWVEGTPSGLLSQRGDVWRRMDPSRSGLIPELWTGTPSYATYAEWALDAGMFFVRREGRLIENTGQTFRSFMADGYQGERACLGDWVNHLNTLFPEARLKGTLEIRPIDSLPPALNMAALALLTGLLYDAVALSEAQAVVAHFDYAGVEDARPRLLREGLAAHYFGRPAQTWALELLGIARRGLERRARLDAAGKSEAVYLDALEALTESGRCPADVLLADNPTREEFLKRATVDAV